MYRADTKLYVLTGFLGSGKTTVLLKLLEILKGHRIGIIQNEFGSWESTEPFYEMTRFRWWNKPRSIFCSCLKLNFVQALAEWRHRILIFVRGEFRMGGSFECAGDFGGS